MKNKVCLYVASVDVGVQLKSHCKQMLCIRFRYDSSSIQSTPTPHSLTADTQRLDRNTDKAPLHWEVNPINAPQHPSSSHLHLVDVGWVVPEAAAIRASLTAAVRYLSGFGLSGANPDARSPVGWIVAATTLELTGDRGKDILRGGVDMVVWYNSSKKKNKNEKLTFNLSSSSGMQQPSCSSTFSSYPEQHDSS